MVPARGTWASKASASRRSRSPARCPPTLRASSTRAGKIVTPGGVEPHAHLAHGIMSHPERAVDDARARGRHRGHGLRRHDHPRRLRLRAAGQRDPSTSSSSARRGGRATRTSTTPSTSRWPARSSSAVFDQIPEAIQVGLSELQGVHHECPAAASEARGQPPRLRAHPLRDGEGRPGGRHHGRPRRGRGSRPVQLRALPRGKAHGGGEPAPRPHEALGVARVRAHDRSRAAPPGWACTSFTPRPARASRPSRRRAPRACPSTARRCTSTRASTPSTTRRRAASARTRIRRSSCPRTRRRSGTVSWSTACRPSPPTSIRPTSS